MALVANNNWERYAGIMKTIVDGVERLRNTPVGEFIGRKNEPNRKYRRKIEDYMKKTKPRVKSGASKKRKLNSKAKPKGQRPKKGKYMGGGSIKVVRKGRKVTPVDGMRVMHKIERGQNFVAFNAIYPGGATHPSYATLRMLCLSLVRFVAKKAKIDFGDFNDSVGLPFIASTRWSFFYYWKGEGQATDDTASFRENIASDAANWSALADRLADSFVNVFGGNQGRRLYLFGAFPNEDVQTSHSLISTQVYHASDLYISIKGESSIQVQNRTLGDGTGDTADASNIFNNPLRGKYYTFKSGRPCIRNVGQIAELKTFLFDYQNTSGSIATQDRFAVGTGTDYSDNIALALRKPPSGNFFTNCKTTKYTTVEPGGILRSKLDCTVSKSLTNWMYAFATKFLTVEPPAAGQPKNLAGMVGSDPVDYRIGMSHCYGLEKMVDTTVVTQPELQVGHEHNLFMVGKVTYRPKNSAVAMITITT